MSRKPSGFTIVELLVVIAVIGILVALLMPAVQAARESARQAQCQSALKQMGTGVGQHITILGRYPTGGWGYQWIGDPDQGNGQNQPGGWIYNLLPYIDQQALHDFGAGAASSVGLRQGGNVVRIMTALPVFNCPSRRRAVDYPLYPSFVLPYMITATAATSTYAPQYNVGAGIVTSPVQPLTGVARSDYAINTGDAAQQVPPLSNSLCEPPPGPTPASATTPPSAVNAILSATQYQNLFQTNTGVSFQQSMVQPGHITDGTNYTFLVGEKAMMPDHYTDGWVGTPISNTFLGDLMSMYAGAGWDISRTSNAPPVQDIPGYGGGCGFCASPSSNANFGSAHPNGVFFLFCDSSVRLIKYGINPTVYTSLGNRSDSTQGYPTGGFPPSLDDTIFK